MLVYQRVTLVIPQFLSTSLGEKLGRDAKRFLPATTLVWRDPTNARPGQVVSGRAAHDLFWYPDKAS